MQIKVIELHNVGIVRDVTIEPGKCMIIHGKNAQGKTTIQNAVLEVFGVKTNAKLLKNGEEKGLATFWFDDELETEVKLKLNESGQKRTVTSGGKPKNIGFFEDFIDALKVNPVDFLNAKKKGERKELLMKVVSFKLTEDQMRRLDIKPEELAGEENHLDYLNKLHDKIYDERTTVNSFAKKNEGAIATIGPVVVEEQPADIKVSITELENREEAVRHSFSERLLANSDHFEKLKESARQTAKKLLKDVQTIYDQKLAELNAWKSGEEKTINSQERATLDGYDTDEHQKKDIIDNERNLETNHISVELTRLRSKLEQAEKSANLKAQRDSYRAELATYEKQSKDYTDHLKLIETIKGEMLANIPLRGVEVKGDDVWVDGRPWDDTNHARRLEVCIDQALLRKGGTIVSDNLESLDSENFELFKEMVTSRGIQLIGARVADCPLTIETEKGKVVL